MTNPATIDESSFPGYRSVLEGAGLLDLSDRGKIRVTGPDRTSFLHAMISNDVEKLETQAGRYGAFLTATGKLVADFYYYKLEEFLLIDVDASLSAPLREGLEKFVIMDDVTLVEEADRWGHLSLQGPRSVETASAALGVGVPAEPLRMALVDLPEGSGWLIRKNHLSASGCEMIVPRPAVESLKSRLLELPGVEVVGPAAAETLRVEHGVPLFGVDMDQKNNPLEARLDQAISFTKGCYIGQEVVAKATYIGGVGRLLACLSLEGGNVPAAGDAVSDGAGKGVGHVTSAVFSPRLRRPIALALLRRTASEPGTRLTVETASGAAPVEVVAGFLSP